MVQGSAVSDDGDQKGGTRRPSAHRIRPSDDERGPQRGPLRLGAFGLPAGGRVVLKAYALFLRRRRAPPAAAVRKNTAAPGSGTGSIASLPNTPMS